jgi:hypothetical protein
VERRRTVIRTAAIVLALLICAPVCAQNRVVLVAAADSPIEMLSSFEVRKIYLGIAVFKNGRTINAVRNGSDPRLSDVFFQSVVGLSEERYERRLLTNVFKYGTVRPGEISDASQIKPLLTANPYAVSYLWVTDEVPTGLKVLRVLWQDY